MASNLASAALRDDPHAAWQSDAHLVPLGGDFALWRDFAVRSVGFPVSGLSAFGAGDEAARLRGVASDPVFREAVTWQNPAALTNAIAKVADGAAAKSSRMRQREELVASYWQRYCAKNDTIGFFGPLAWGRIADDGPALSARSGALVGSRSVHLEAWGVQALAETIDPGLKVAAGPHAERELRARLQHHPDGTVRERGLAALERLEAARDAVAQASPGELREALAALDSTFIELTGRAPVRNHGRAYGARTLAYLDCMRDLDVTAGPAMLTDMAPALRVLFEAGRWYCGQVNAIGRELIEESLPASRRAPFQPVLAQVIGALIQVPSAIGNEMAELQRRLAVLLADPDPTTIGVRAASMFADHQPAWPTGVFQSVDLQLAARDAAAICAGDYLAVIGDAHPGANPLVQGLFAHRHPDPPAMWRAIRNAIGRPVPYLMPPFGPGLGVDARGAGVTAADDIHIAILPDTRAPWPRRTWLPHELLVDGHDLVDRAGELRVPLLDAFGLAIFIAAVRTFELLPDDEYAPRRTIGRTVLRRESWSLPAREIPQQAQDLTAFARELGMPRRLFAKSPLERKPMYLDTDSPTLARVFCHHARQAADQAPEARIRFTEMLPAPDQCWLDDAEGNRYVSELRLVAVDQAHQP
ncbi:MAG: lantibiotic dehydratase [Solirubrobacterales bacterium]|nr:lantibiotic dehydratase [Solirubrobacterales bacterium]